MRAMQRVVAILESVSDSAIALTPARVSEETELSLSTVSRIMRELAEERMLDRAPDGTYVLGDRVFSLVLNAVNRPDRDTVVTRVLQDVRDLTGETASLHIRHRDQRICIASAMSRHSLRRVISVGETINLVGTVPGDVLMASATLEERESVVSAVFSGDAVAEHLETMRVAAERGYSAVSVDVMGITGIAVPVMDGSEVRSALAVSGPTSRFSLEIAESWLPELERAARRLGPWANPE